MPGVLPPPVFLTPRSGPTAARIAPARSWSARARAPRSLRSCSSGAAPAACGSSLRRPRRFDTRPIARRYSRRHHPLQSRSHAGRGGRETQIAPRSQHRSLGARRLDRRTPRPRDLCAAPRGGVAARAARPNHSHGEALPPAVSHEYAVYHRPKLALLAESAEHANSPAGLASFLEAVPKTCPHNLFTASVRASQTAADFITARASPRASRRTSPPARQRSLFPPSATIICATRNCSASYSQMIP